MKPAFNIGDKVWYAERFSTEERVTCIDCQGKRALTVIMGDGSHVSIDCSLCARGYEPPRGYITYSKQVADVRQVAITRIEQGPDKIEYGADGYFYRSQDVFATREEAQMRAEELAEEFNREELERINSKEKPDRNWRWHVRYHRECIRRAEKELEYHRAKLAVAKVKAKDVEVVEQ